MSFQEECNLEGIINTKLASNEETGGGQKPDMNGNAVAKHRKYSHGKESYLGVISAAWGIKQDNPLIKHKAPSCFYRKALFTFS